MRPCPAVVTSIPFAPSVSPISPDKPTLSGTRPPFRSARAIQASTYSFTLVPYFSSPVCRKAFATIVVAAKFAITSPRDTRSRMTAPIAACSGRRISSNSHALRETTEVLPPHSPRYSFYGKVSRVGFEDQRLIRISLRTGTNDRRQQNLRLRSKCIDSAEVLACPCRACVRAPSNLGRRLGLDTFP